MLLGVLLLLFGVLMMLDRIGILRGDVWDYLLPIALIALGAHFITSYKKRKP